MLKRPYTNDSIDKLEEIFETASGTKNTQSLLILHHELQFRRTPRGKELHGIVAAHLEALGINPAQDDQPAQSHHQPHSEASAKAFQANNFSRQTSKGVRREPTGEQAEAIRLFNTGGSLKINAYAGSGKTSTLEFLAASTNRRGHYLAFNRSIVADARRKFPSTVTCTTTHGLAFSAMAGRFNGNTGKLTQSLTPNHIVGLLNLTSWRVTETVTLNARSLGYLIRETIHKFTISASSEISIDHVPVYGGMTMLPGPSLTSVQHFCLKGARHIWARMIDPADDLALGHDGYLKLWALGAPSIKTEYILLDEAQDTNAVLLGVLKHQTCQIVFVGDRYQQIYEWRGAENAMERFETAHSSSLTTSFRFGNGIAAGANKILGFLDAPDTLKGNPARTSRIAPVPLPRAILARSNANVIAAVIEALDGNRRPHLIGGAEDLKRMLRGVIHLKDYKPTDVPEFFGFTSWNDVLEFAGTEEGEHLVTFVKLVEERGETHLLWLLDKVVEETDADVVISTVHKAKGREWPTVRLVGDFLQTATTICPKTGRRLFLNTFEPASLRLLYVAMTRAQETVEFSKPLIELLRNGPSPVGPREQPSLPAHTNNRSNAERQNPESFSRPTDWTTAGQNKNETSDSQSPPGEGGAQRIMKWFGR